MKQVRKQYILIGIIGFLVFGSLYVFVPWLRKPLVRENNILELLQVFLYLSSVVLGLRQLKKNYLPQFRGRQIFLIALSLLFVLEELSYGDTLYPIYGMLSEVAPRIHGVKIDAMHDFIQVFYVVFQEDMLWLVLGIIVVCSSLIAILFFKGRSLSDLRVLVVFFQENPSFEFVCICGVFLIFAAFLDLEIILFPSLLFCEEFLETLAALALLFAVRVNCCILNRSAPRDPEPTGGGVCPNRTNT